MTILLPQAALAGEWYRCRSGSKVRATCCCGPAHAGQREAQEERTELRGTPCCALVRYEPRALQACTETIPGSRAAAPVLALVSAPPPPVGAAGARACALAERATAPPASLEPLYLRHASLLL